MGCIAYDPTSPVVDKDIFNNNADWMDFYGEVEEELPANMPKPHGNLVGNVVTHHSHSGILIFVQNAPIIWFLKRQNTVKGATFRSELVAMTIAMDLIIGLQYKLHMFGVPIDGPAKVFCDNHGVVKNLSILESMLMKKHNAINYHAV